MLGGDHLYDWGRKALDLTVVDIQAVSGANFVQICLMVIRGGIFEHHLSADQVLHHGIEIKLDTRLARGQVDDSAIVVRFL